MVDLTLLAAVFRRAAAATTLPLFPLLRSPDDMARLACTFCHFCILGAVLLGAVPRVEAQAADYSSYRYSSNTDTSKSIVFSTSKCTPKAGAPCVETGNMHVVEYEQFSVAQQGCQLNTITFVTRCSTPVCTGTASTVYEEAKLGCHALHIGAIPDMYYGKHQCSDTDVTTIHSQLDSTCNVTSSVPPSIKPFGVCKASGCNMSSCYFGLKAKRCATMSCTKTTFARTGGWGGHYYETTLSCTPIAAIGSKVGSGGAFKSQVPWFLFTALIALAAR
jgi:hypothetical protein